MAESVFLDYISRGRIKLVPDDKSKSIVVRAEDVTVEKRLPLSTSEGLDGVDYSVDGASSTSTDSAGNTTSETSEPTLVIKFKITITPKDMTRSSFKQKRANYLFDFEDNTFTAVSDMFRKAIKMQFTDLQYVIPAGEESAFYQIEMTQVEKAEDDRTTPASETTTGFDITAYMNGDATITREQMLQAIRDETNKATTPK